MSTQQPENANNRLAELEESLRLAAEGSPNARMDLHRSYARFLVYAIWSKLKRGHPLRRVCEPDEIVQDVGKVLFRNDLPPRIFQSRLIFFAYLKRVVRNRFAELIRKHLQTKKSDLNREVLFSNVSLSADIDLVCRRPTPDQVCAAKDEWDRLSRGLPPKEVYMLHLLRHGRTHKEVACNLDIEERTVDRLLAKLKKRARRPRLGGEVKYKRRTVGESVRY